MTCTEGGTARGPGWAAGPAGPRGSSADVAAESPAELSCTPRVALLPVLLYRGRQLVGMLPALPPASATCWPGKGDHIGRTLLTGNASQNPCFRVVDSGD